MLSNSKDKLENFCDIKGKVTVELINAETNKLEFKVECDNLILQKSINQALGTELVRQLTKNMIWSGIVQRTNVNNLNRLFNGIVLGEENTEPDASEHGFWGKFVAYAGTQLFTGVSNAIGSINFSESFIDTENRKIRFVFDFATNVANTSFQSVSFVSGNIASSFSTPYSVLPYDFELVPALDMPKFKNSALQYPSGSYATVPFMIDSVNNEYYLVTLGYGSNLFKKVSSGDIVTNVPNPKLANGSDIYPMTMIPNAVSFLGYTYIPYDTKLLKYLDGNVFTDNAIEITMPFQISAMCYIGDGKIAVTTPSTGIDSVVGERYANFIYILDASNMSILRRIRRYYSEFIGNEYRTFGKGCLFYDSDEKILINLTGYYVSYPSIPKYGFSYSMKEEDEDNEAIGFSLSYQSFGNAYDSYAQPNYLTSLDGSKVYMGIAMDNPNSSAYGTFFKYVNNGSVDNVTMLMSVTTKGMSKLSRVLLPAPVTKVSTQTMKITYDLIFPEEMFV